MFQPEREKADPKSFEQVKVNDLLPTTIEAVQYEEAHAFKGFQGKADTIQPGVRFKFLIDGYKFPKYSRWMKFNYSEKSNLYSKYLKPLVEGILPDAKFDIDNLINLRVKTLWKQNGDFQNLELIVPEDKALPYTDKQSEPLPF